MYVSNLLVLFALLLQPLFYVCQLPFHCLLEAGKYVAACVLCLLFGALGCRNAGGMKGTTESEGLRVE